MMYTPCARPFASIPTRRWSRSITALLVLTMLLTARAPSRPGSIVPAVSAVASSFARLPSSFIPNAGQTDPAVRFHLHSMGGTFFFTPDGVVLSLPTPPQAGTVRTETPDSQGPLHQGQRGDAPVARSTPPTVVRLRFEGANPAPQVSGAERLPGIVNTFIGDDPARWHTELPTYAGVLYRQLYPGIDLRYDGTEGLLKGTYTVAPGAEPNRIRWRYAGATSVRAEEATGDLLISLPRPAEAGLGARGKGCSLRERAPAAWQTIQGQRIPVAVRYTVADDGSIGFALGAYDRGRALNIDPTLDYSTYLGGSDGDYGRAIAVDGGGNAYVTGSTHSTDLPTTPGAFDTTYNGSSDAFVAKLNRAGSGLVYATYLGGSGNDEGYGIAVDAFGDASLTGHTNSIDFPTVNPFQPGHGGGSDAFVTKLNARGSALVYSTYLGGSRDDAGRGIAVDVCGHAYVTGETDSTDFPTVNPFQPANGGSRDAFMAKVNATGSALVYSTYLGGTDLDMGAGIAVDASGNAYVTGQTDSTDFPTRNPLQPANAGYWDAFVAKLNPAGSALVYATYLGGTAPPGYPGASGNDYGRGIAVDASDRAYVTGYTASIDFPTVNALQPAYAGYGDAFVVKLNRAGSKFVYATYLGGGGVHGSDGGEGIAAGGCGSAVVTGGAGYSFPTVNGPQPVFGGGFSDAFVAELNPTGSALVYATYLGGSGEDAGSGIAVDSAGDAYVVGSTDSTDFPTTPGAFDTTYNGSSDAFVAKIGGMHWKAGDWVDYAPSGVPDFDQRQDAWQDELGNWNTCGPVALANSLWWFDSKFEPHPLPPPIINDGYPLVTAYGLTPDPFPTIDDHDAQNVPRLVEDLAFRLDTGGQRTGVTHSGTYAVDFRPAIEAYLAARGLADDYVVEELASPDFEWVVEQVGRSQDVILLLGFWQRPGEEWGRVGGHYVTVAGIDAGGLIAFSDPAADAAEAGGPGRVLPGPHGIPHPSTLHNEAAFVSHDIYTRTQTRSPGGTWGPDDYAARLGGCEFASRFLNQNWPGPEHPGPLSCDPGLPISVEVEYAIAVSPVGPWRTSVYLPLLVRSEQ